VNKFAERPAYACNGSIIAAYGFLALEKTFSHHFSGHRCQHFVSLWRDMAWLLTQFSMLSWEITSAK
jgi:hypothetical protein